MIEILNLNFGKYEEVKEHIRKIMYKILSDEINDETPIYYISKDNEHYKMLKYLAKQNGDKKIMIKEKGIKFFCVQPNERNKKTFQTHVQFKDDTKENISFLNCVDMMNPKKQNNDYEHDLEQAMRKSVNQQIQFFCDNNKTKICEKCDTTKNIQVDHVIKFRDIKSEFLKDNKHKIEFVTDTIYGGKKLADNSIEFATNWNAYHEKMYVLRYLCQTCNLKEERKKK